MRIVRKSFEGNEIRPLIAVKNDSKSSLGIGESSHRSGWRTVQRVVEFRDSPDSGFEPGDGQIPL
jgi:hypothetical protein